MVRVAQHGNVLRPLSCTFKKWLEWGTSLVGQWLRTRFPVQGTWDQSLVRELGSHMQQGN